MTSEVPLIPSKKLQSIQPALFLVIDGVNLLPHPSKPRMLALSDEIEINYMVLHKLGTAEDINMELLYNVLLYVQSTALNMSGQQRLFLRTRDKKLIAVDPRLDIPRTFDLFSEMMFHFLTKGLVRGPGGERLMYYANSDLGHVLPPGVRRICVFTDEKAPVTVVQKGQKCVYLSVDGKWECQDELMSERNCISNDRLSCTTTAARVIANAELENDLW